MTRICSCALFACFAVLPSIAGAAPYAASMTDAYLNRRNAANSPDSAVFGAEWNFFYAEYFGEGGGANLDYFVLPPVTYAGMTAPSWGASGLPGAPAIGPIASSGPLNQVNLGRPATFTGMFFRPPPRGVASGSGLHRYLRIVHNISGLAPDEFLSNIEITVRAEVLGASSDGVTLWTSSRFDGQALAIGPGPASQQWVVPYPNTGAPAPTNGSILTFELNAGATNLDDLVNLEISISANILPAPGGAGMVLAAGLALSRRRRR